MKQEKSKLKSIISGIMPKFMWEASKKVYYFLLLKKFKYFGRPDSKGETDKAKGRRERENFFKLYCNGKGLDIGYGGNLLCDNCKGFDMEDGDAQFLKKVKDSSYDFVYSSHTLEHMNDEEIAIKNWWRVLKPGGYLLLYLPHRDLFEKKRYLPSRFSESHYRFFLPDEEELPDTVGVKQLIERTLTDFEIVYCKVCDEGFIAHNPEDHSEGEYSIEAVIQKLV